MKKVTYLEDITSEKNWKIVLHFALQKAEYIDFNLLYEDKEVEKFVEKFHQDYIGRLKKGYIKKMFISGDVLRFKASESIKEFMIDQPFKYWKNAPLEDPSFYYNEEEFVSTITHENLVQLSLNKEEKIYFLENDFLLNHPLIFEEDDFV